MFVWNPKRISPRWNLLLFSFFLVEPLTVWSDCSPSPCAPVRTADSRYGRLPLRFEPNLGQFDKHVRYVSRAAGYTLFLAEDEAVMVLRRPSAPSPMLLPQRPDAPLEEQEVVRMKLVGARPAAGWQESEKQAGVSNYFLGNDPTKWRTGVPGYGRVVARRIYPGVDWVWYGNQGKLEYDLAVAPGADPSQVRFAWEGASSPRLNADGDLVLATRLGEVVQKRPRVYQQDGIRRIEIASRYVLTGGNQAQFALARYDRRLPLSIDPLLLVYSTYLGGSGGDVSSGIAVDSAGSAYIVGTAVSANFPTQSAFQTSFKGQTAVYVTKLSPDGSKLVYSTFLAGSGGDSGAGVAVDSAGSAYVTGSTNSRDFPTMAPFQSAAKASPSAFVTELSPAGNSLVYSTYLGGSTYDAGTAIAVDSSGSAYVTGATESLDFPTTQSAFQPLIDQSLLFANTYTSNAFLTKFNPSGSALVYSTFLGGNNGDEGLAVAADASGSAYVAGLTGSSNFPTKAAFESLYKTSSNFSGFLTKFNASGSALVYSTYLGGSAQDQANGVAVDASGTAYVAGVTFSADFPTANPYQKSNNTPSTPIENYFHNGAAFVAKFLATGTVVYSTYLGGSVGDGASAIAVDATGAAYVTGSAGSPDFPTVSAYQAKMAGKGAAFVTKFSPDGTSLLYSTFLGGSGSDRAVGIALDAAAAAYVTGVATSTDFPTQSPYQAKLPGSKSGFVSKLSQPPAGPIITKVANAEGEGAAIAPNTWVEIKGTDLAPAGDTRTWQGSDFVNGQMPTMLDGVSATVNGQAAYIYYISPTQINILTPPAAISGTVSVVVTYQTASAPFTVPAQTESPSFFVFNGGPYVAATHLNGSYIGPTTLYPGATTPAQPGEIVVLYANGFGPTSATLVAGSSTQIGILSPLPVVTIGGVTATVQFAGLVAPGEYQFNVVVPTSLADGDQTIAATYNGSTTQSGTLLTVHQ